MTSHKTQWAYAWAADAPDLFAAPVRSPVALPDAPIAMPVQSLEPVRLADFLRGLTTLGARRARS